MTRKILPFIFSILILQSCIPLRIAPNIENYKVSKGKKFKRSLPKRQMFIFEDPKDTNHFYRFVDKKFSLDNQKVYDDVPFELAGEQYFFSFYEVEIPTKTLNIGAVFADALLVQMGNNTLFEEQHTSRKGHWYIAMEVYNDIEKDCLSSEALSREIVLSYLTTLKKEYLTTYNYLYQP